LVPREAGQNRSWQDALAVNNDGAHTSVLPECDADDDGDDEVTNRIADVIASAPAAENAMM
jgi:hypothetical protein